MKECWESIIEDFKKHALSGTLLFEKCKGQPFETFARAQENK